jgi:hypothetical protein
MNIIKVNIISIITYGIEIYGNKQSLETKL